MAVSDTSADQENTDATEGKQIGFGKGFWGYLGMFGTILASLRSRAPEGWRNLKSV